jgi:hypothetical protein
MNILGELFYLTTRFCSPYNPKGMAILILIVALIFLIGGGVGLFYVNVNLGSGTALWTCGNIAFGTFAAVGVIICIFLALFNAEME